MASRFGLVEEWLHYILCCNSSHIVSKEETLVDIFSPRVAIEMWFHNKKVIGEWY
jgi:hypothetical protein